MAKNTGERVALGAVQIGNDCFAEIEVRDQLSGLQAGGYSKVSTGLDLMGVSRRLPV